MYLGRDKGVFGRFVALVGIIQSVTWITICLTCIVFYYHNPDLPSVGTSYGQYLQIIITNYFIKTKSDSSATDTRIVRPSAFHAFLWVYLVASAIWIAASVDEYAAIKYNKARQGHVALLLGILILLISTLDMIFVSFLMRDLGECVFPVLEKDGVVLLSGPPDCHIATGIVMTVAARGFVMWFINIVLGIGMICASADVFRRSTPNILSYENNTLPRIQLGKGDPSLISSLGKENPFFRSGLNPTLNQTRSSTPNRNTGTPAALTGRNNTNLYF